MTDLELRNNLAKNLIFYRKESNYTQAQLAEKISYSDKAVSKWERGESLPDVYIMVKLAEIFNISVNDLLSTTQVRNSPVQRRNHLIITLLSSGLVWVVAALIFVVLKLCSIEMMFTFLPFFYGLMCSAIVALIFSCIWADKKITFWLITILIWSFLTAVFYTMYICGINEAYVVYLLGIPSQFLNIFFVFFRKQKNNENNR